MNQLLSLIQETGKTQRKSRRPQHTFFVEHRPWQIQPVMIAPVLPGETLKSASLKARIVSDPLASGAGNILPWWAEHHLFYVKLRDLPYRSAVEDLMLKGTPMTANETAAKAGTYHAKGMDYTLAALQRVTEEFFMDEDEVYANNPLIGGMPIQSAIKRGHNWSDSLMVDGALPTANDLQNPHDPLVDPDAAAQYEQYQVMRAMRVIDMDFEDWLATFGIRTPAAEKKDRPELLRTWSQWSYPSNTVDPATGLASGAVVFSIDGSADKDRFFKEPGFLFCVTSLRPKIFMGNQRQAAAHSLDRATDWAPALMRDMPHLSVKEFLGGTTTATGPLYGQTAGYWFDLRDLFMYGDQFLNGAALAGYAPALPAASGERRWATDAMATALFASGTANKIRQDGIISLNILGHATTAVDHT